MFAICQRNEESLNQIGDAFGIERAYRGAGPTARRSRRSAGLAGVPGRLSRSHPDAFDTPTLQAVLYYNSFTSLMLALEENEGVVEENEGESLRATMSELTWESPIGGLSRNENRQAETSIFICEVVGTGDEQLGRSWSSRSTASSRATPCGSVWTGAPDAR